MKLLISTFFTLLLIGSAGSSYGQGVICTSNADEIASEISRTEENFKTRSNQLRRQRGREILEATSRYSYIGNAVPEQNRIRNRYSGLLADVDLQKSLAISDLRSRIVEICEEKQESRSYSQQNSNTGKQDAVGIVKGLQDLAELHEKGLLTDEEFNVAKRKLLGL